MSTFKIAHLAPGMELSTGHCRWIKLKVIEVNRSDDPNWMTVGWSDPKGNTHQWKIADGVREYQRTLDQIEADAIAACR